MKTMILPSPPNGVANTPIKRRKLSASATDLLTDRDGRGLPCYIRAPVRGLEFYSSTSRAKLYDLAGKGLIRSFSLREPGQIKGTRLFDLQSVLAYIAKNEVQPISCPNTTGGDQQAEANNPAAPK